MTTSRRMLAVVDPCATTSSTSIADMDTIDDTALTTQTIYYSLSYLSYFEDCTMQQLKENLTNSETPS